MEESGSSVPTVECERSGCMKAKVTLTKIKELLGTQTPQNSFSSSSTNEIDPKPDLIQKISQLIIDYDEDVISPCHKTPQEILSNETGDETPTSLESEKLKQLGNQIATNNLIIAQLFTYLSIATLSTCRLVSRTWLETSNLVLRTQRICMLKISSCDKVAKVKMLHAMGQDRHQVPFNGFQLDCCTCTFQQLRQLRETPTESHNLISSILKTIEVRHLCLIGPVHCQNGCPTFILIKNIMETQSKCLTTLEVPGCETGGYVEILTPLTFERLKRIILWKVRSDQTLSFSKLIIERAPNLQHVDGFIPPVLADSLAMKNKLSLVKSMFCQPNIADVTTCQKLVENYRGSKVKLEKLHLESTKHDQFAPLRMLKETMRSLFGNFGSNSLTSLELDHFDFPMFIGSYMPTLNKVTEMTIQVENSLFGGPPLRRSTFFNKINYDEKFPLLKDITIHRPRYWIKSVDARLALAGHNDEDMNELSWTNSPSFVCSTVDTIRLDSLSVWQIAHYSLIFTSVRSLILEEFRKCKEVLPLIWSSASSAWTGLHSLRLEVSAKSIWDNLDSAFTGIHHAQCQKLRESKRVTKYENWKDLKVNSGITDLKELKVLQINIQHESDDDCEEEEESRDDIFLTEVTSKTAFASMPDLEVTIRRDNCSAPKQSGGHRKCHLELECLKPEVNIIGTH